MADLDAMVAKLLALVSEGKREEAQKLLAVIEDRLENDEHDNLTRDDLQSVVRCLIDATYLHEAEHFLETMAMADRLEPKNHLDRVQVAIDRGCQSFAIPALASLAETFKDDPYLFAEAKGLTGRAHKDLFLRALKGNRAAAARHLDAAIERYGEGLSGPREQRGWVAGNILGLAMRGEAEGMRPKVDLDLDRLAASIETDFENTPEGKREFYTWTSLAEARIFKEDWSGAHDALNGALAATDGTIFKLNTTLRQAKELWQLQKRSEGASQFVTEMERLVLTTPKGEISLDASDIQRQKQSNEDALEAQFSDHRLHGEGWMRRFLDLGEFVASVVNRNSGSVKGTCCIIDGGQLHPDFEGMLLGLTNDHVISEFPELYTLSAPLRPDEAAVRFTLSADPEKQYAIDSVLWSSPFEIHDTCLFTFKTDLPVAGSKLKIVDFLPPAPATPPPEVFVISHPNPDEPSYSFQNTELLMHDQTLRGDETVVPGYLQYSTGTIKGSSGGVALNGALAMIGLHHAGGEKMKRADGKPGTHAANEAIWIQAIVNALAQSRQAGETRWTG